MADIRINALATTAASTASDDFVAVDGSANGTRKLNAYSPTFGGNATVGGTLTAGLLVPTLAVAQTGQIGLSASAGIELCGKTGSANDFVLYNGLGQSVISNATGTRNATLAGNLTVSGTGTSSVAGSLILGASSSAVETAWTASGYAGHISFPDTSQFSVFSEPNSGYRGGGLACNVARVGGGWSFVDSTKPAWRVYFGNGSFVDNFTINRSGATTYSESTLFQLTSGGNLLIGTPTDGGQKLQVKGGVRVIDSGNDSNYITIGSGNDAPAGGNSFIAQTGTLVVGTAASASLILRTGGTTALTLDSSQNATFAGSVTTGTPNGGTAGAWKLGVRVAATTTLDTTQYLQVDIGGTLYKVALVTS